MRSYHFGPLKNPNPRKLAPFAVQAPHSSSSLWSLPPKTVAFFAGELSRVMLEAAEQYVYEKTLDRAAKNFHREAWRSSMGNHSKSQSKS